MARYPEHSLTLLLAAMLALPLTSCVSRSGSGATPGHVTRSVSTREGVKWVATVPGKIAPGDACPLVLRIENHGTNQLTCWSINDYRELGLTVYDPSSRPCDHTPFGYSVLGGSDDAWRRVRIFIPPGESHSWTVDLARCFLLKPGRHRVSASITPAGSAPLAVDDLHFVVH